MRGEDLSVASAEGFMMEGVDLLYVVGVAKRVFLVGIVGGACGFVSIADRRATSKLIVPFLFLTRFRTLQP